MKVSEFFVQNINPFVLGCFYSRFECDEAQIKTFTTYKLTKWAPVFLKSQQPYLEQLNRRSFENWQVLSSSGKYFKACLTLENDLHLSATSFFNKLYYKILNSELISSDILTDDKIEFIRGFMETRGSIDTQRSLIAQDYFYHHSYLEVRKARILVEYFNVPVSVMNLNFRQLQPQYLAKKNKRNAQVRMQLPWYVAQIGILNPYKVQVITDVYGYPLGTYRNGAQFFNVPYSVSPSQSFQKRIDYYADKILNRKLSSQQIKQYQKELGFLADASDERTIRNDLIVQIARLEWPDECVCCKNLYNICDRSFIHRKTNRPYFEIHHVISLGNNQELDDTDNLAKLCPTCHAALKRGRALEVYQKELIANILNNQDRTLEFSKNFFDTDDENVIINKIYESLK